MNYYGPRQQMDNKLWYWTCHNRRIGTWAVGACAECNGHKTAEEARRHETYRIRGLIEKATSTTLNVKSLPCQGKKDCKNQTDQNVSVGHLSFVLCDDCRKDASWYVQGDTISSW